MYIRLALLAVVISAHSTTFGQDFPLKSRFPEVPLQEPRPLESQDLKMDRAAPDKPVGGFVKSLKGTEAAVKLILGQSRLLTLKAPISADGGAPVVGVGDPTVVDFQLLPNARMIRLTARRAGLTDFTITTDDGQTYSFEIEVGYDLDLLSAQLKQLYPGTALQLGQIREHIVVEGLARSPNQVNAIIQTVEAFLTSMQVRSQVQTQGEIPQSAASPRNAQPTETDPEQPDQENQEPQATVAPLQGQSSVQGQFAAARIINLLRVPGVQQVMLQVKIAELNRTALREIGTDIFVGDDAAILGTQIAGNSISLAGIGLGPSTTGFGVFPSGKLDVFLRALRRNSVLTVLAEPNLVAMNGQNASFLAGGEFPVPVPQGGTTGGGSVITIEFKSFGVQLNFTPHIMDDGVIRLRVAPEASTVDDSLGAEIAGFVVPGVNTRRLNTTVEMKQGQTLALAGLLNVELDAQTSRIPGLGDLPYIGRMFSNTSNRRREVELLVLVTPYLVGAMKPGQTPPLPGQEIMEPNDLEVYLLGRLEGRTGTPHRSTTHWDDPLRFTQRMRLERQRASSQVGFVSSGATMNAPTPIYPQPHSQQVHSQPWQAPAPILSNRNTVPLPTQRPVLKTR